MVTQAERRAVTRERILYAAREHFGRDGYHNTSIEAILQTAGVTKGALYHHFDDKQQLLRAVYEDLEATLVARLADAATAHNDPIDALRAGMRAFLHACLDPQFGRIVLVDAPAALGWQVWRDIDAKYGFGLLRAGVDQAIAAGRMVPLPADHLAHILLAAVMEAALLTTRSPSPAAALEELATTLDAILDGLSKTR
jgi:AcrR family transcriptional regulator